MEVQDNRAKRNQLLAEHIIKNLQRRNMAGYYAGNKQEALKTALGLIEKQSTVGWGGSASITETGLKQAVCEGDYRVINRDVCKTLEEKRKAELKCFDCDYFLASSNAITQDGILVNIDKMGNRIAALAYGPKNVILLVGMNKVVKTVDEAINRAHNEAASINAIRFGTDTPCKNKGLCYDCKGQDTLCCHILVTRNSGIKERIKVILVNDNLGY